MKEGGASVHVETRPLLPGQRMSLFVTMNVFRVMKWVGLAAVVVWAVVAVYLRDPWAGFGSVVNYRIEHKRAVAELVLECQSSRRTHGYWPARLPISGEQYRYAVSESPDGSCRIGCSGNVLGPAQIWVVFNATNVWSPDGRSWTNDSDYAELIRIGSLEAGAGGEMVLRSYRVPK